MSEPLCRDCQDLRREVKATRIVVKTPVCDEHWRQRLGQPPAPVKLEEMKMGRTSRIDESTIARIQSDAKEGLSFSQIAEKRSVSWPTAKRYASERNGRPYAGGGGAKAAKSTLRGGRFKDAAKDSYSIQLTSAGMDALWNGLPPEKKAELLTHL